MHKLVKKVLKQKHTKLADNPADLFFSGDSTKKRGENQPFQLEVKTEAQWEALLKRPGLIVVDVYSGWTGPCNSMLSILRQLKLDTNDDRLTLASALADKIEQLAPFRDQSEPCWLFFGDGKPVNILRGTNAPKLLRTIKTEFKHELDCMEGKAKRNSISIDIEAGRKEAAVDEAITLIELLELEEEERRNPPVVVKVEEEKEMVIDRGCITLCMKEKWSEIKSTDENESEEEEEEEEVEDEETRRIREENEAIAERRRLMEESNEKLKKALRKYTVIAVQSYLLETGALSEVKDHLMQDFKIIRERLVHLNEDDARKLFGVPEEIPDPSPPPPSESEHEALSIVGDSNESLGGRFSSNAFCENLDVDRESISLPNSPAPRTETGASGEIQCNENETEEGGKILGSDEVAGISEKDDGIEDNGEEESGGDETSEKEKIETPPIRMIPVDVPEDIIGDTLIVLLECNLVKPVALEVEDSYSFYVQEDYDADYYIRCTVGPEDYDFAVASKPESFNAIYGRQNYVSGVWCPRTFEEKRFVMLNYFPYSVTEMFMSPTTPVPDKCEETENMIPEENADNAITQEKQQ